MRRMLRQGGLAGWWARLRGGPADPPASDDPADPPAPPPSLTTVEGLAVTLWAVDTIWLGADLLADGSLLIRGQDLGGPALLSGVTEYEWALAVDPPDVDTLRAELGAGTDQELMAGLASRGEEIFTTGETGWLRARGIEAEYWGRHGFD
jgi:hypothetical protein